jgi:hypothetical protein
MKALLVLVIACLTLALTSPGDVKLSGFRTYSVPVDGAPVRLILAPLNEGPTVDAAVLLRTAPAGIHPRQGAPRANRAPAERRPHRSTSATGSALADRRAGTGRIPPRPFPIEKLCSMRNPSHAISLTVLWCSMLLLGACGPTDGAIGESTGDFETQVEDYIQKFPYQDTHDYAMRYTGGDPANFNLWALGKEPVLVKAGDDKVVRMNNDTFYKMAFLLLDEGPVVLGSSAASQDRFSSFQLMDDRNANYHNVIHPDGTYTLYTGDEPAQIEGEAIEVPSALSVVIVRVEVKNLMDAADLAAAEAVFNGITISGPAVHAVPELDLLSGFSESVSEEAVRRIDEAFATVAFTETVAGPGEEPGKDVPYLNFAAGTKGGWGGPDPSHSSYETVFADAAGNTLDGSLGTYTITTEEPPVDAFWSVTVYDTARGGFLHPNEHDRYHINNTAAVKNADGSVTFTFKPSCEDGDLNCLEVPAGPFDLVMRYYLPKTPITSGKWTMPKAQLQ